MLSPVPVSIKSLVEFSTAARHQCNQFSPAHFGSGTKLTVTGETFLTAFVG